MVFDVVNLFGDGIFRVDGDKWKEQRQTASPLFHFNNLQSFIPVSFLKVKYFTVSKYSF